ncbi:hypothetical protein AVEN_201363-1 [Araneus ventricosus]|uniref:Uncharacterized protein n=1 Tax=Araneus ventricosus TaxID=182803 RepID=A0A4Y2TJY5_ARAVE|nr:hypothetical protein AVEN_201363-1 [Araneus ventricosus]
MSKRPSWATRKVCSPENMEKIRRPVLRSPNRSARKHSSELGFRNRSVCPFIAFRLSIPSLQIGRCATVEARGLLPAAELFT